MFLFFEIPIFIILNPLLTRTERIKLETRNFVWILNYTYLREKCLFYFAKLRISSIFWLGLAKHSSLKINIYLKYEYVIRGRSQILAHMLNFVPL